MRGKLDAMLRAYPLLSILCLVVLLNTVASDGKRDRTVHYWIRLTRLRYPVVITTGAVTQQELFAVSRWRLAS